MTHPGTRARRINTGKQLRQISGIELMRNFCGNYSGN